MIEFYTWGQALRLFIAFLLAFGVLSQTLAAILSYFRHIRNLKRIWKILLELFALALILGCSLLHGQAVYGYLLGLVPPTPWPFGGRVFAYFYIAAIVFLPARSVYICIARYKEIKADISVFSVKNAVDSLHTGVMFGERDGFILLSNEKMQRLMEIITGKIQRDGNYFYGLLSSGNITTECQKIETGDQIVCLLPDNSAWMFTRTELRIKKRVYIQLTASDITEQWKLTAELRRQNDQLKQKSDELNEIIAKLHILSREKEIQKAKLRAHDILGERLTLTLSFLRNEQALDIDLLRAQTRDLFGGLKSSQNAASPRDKYDGMRQAYKTIGVEIRLDGELPDEDIKGYVFVDAIKESAVNAVRHGYATVISARAGGSDTGWHLEIADNGRSSAQPIIEGGGIGGMRSKAERLGGSLNIVLQPCFTVYINLPKFTGEEENDV